MLGDEERHALLEEMALIVERSHLFKSLDDEARRRVLMSGFVCSFPAGEQILEEGAEGDTMYLLLDGTVRVTTGKVHLADLGRDACIGEVSVLTGGPRTATVVALTDVSCVAFQRHRIARILVDYPKVRALLESIVESRARDTVEKIIDGS
jgi:CRP-like cAMP-binding protein